MIDDLMKETEALLYNVERLLPEAQILTQEIRKLSYNALMELNGNPMVNLISVNNAERYSSDIVGMLMSLKNSFILFKGNLNTIKYMEDQKDERGKDNS